MAQCKDHDWKYGPDATTADELLTNITNAGDKGLWIKDSEMSLANDLVAQNKIVFCGICERAAHLV